MRDYHVGESLRPILGLFPGMNRIGSSPRIHGEAPVVDESGFRGRISTKHPSWWKKRLLTVAHPRGGSFQAPTGIPTRLRARGGPFWAPQAVFAASRARGGPFWAPQAVFAASRARGGSFRAPTGIPTRLRARGGSFRAPTGIPTRLRARGGPFQAPTAIIAFAHQNRGCQAPSGASEARAGSLRCDSKRVAAGFGAEPKFSVPHQRLAEAEQGWVVR